MTMLDNTTHRAKNRTAALGATPSAAATADSVASADGVVIDGEIDSQRHTKALAYTWAVTRISLGFVFLWAFADKLVGLGKATPSASAWIKGGSPTGGFLKGVQGPFAGIFNSLAGSAWADWLFMIGLLGIGLALTLGIGMRVAAATGSLLLLFMWAAVLPIKTNPFMEDHLIYAMVLVGLALAHAGNTLGLGRWWSNLSIVRRWPVLQ